MYDKEADGRKPNTTRFTDDWDKERWDDFYYADSITIVNTKNLRSFTRQIVDKSIFKNLAIISWLHPSNNIPSKKDCSSCIHYVDDVCSYTYLFRDKKGVCNAFAKNNKMAETRLTEFK